MTIKSTHFFHLHQQLCEVHVRTHCRHAGAGAAKLLCRMLCRLVGRGLSYTPLQLHKIAPENRLPKRKVVFQPSIFKGYVGFRECNQLTPRCGEACIFLLEIGSPAPFPLHISIQMCALQVPCHFSASIV